MTIGNLRSGRSRNAGWQWLVIGLVLGFGCAVAVFIGLYALGVVRLNTSGADVAAAPTAPPAIVMTGETPEVTATDRVIVVTATSSGITVMQPSPTTIPPTEDPAGLTPTPDPDETTVAAIPTESGGQTAALEGTPLTTPVPTTEGEVGAVDPMLASALSPMQLISGGDFQMGTTLQEAQAAVSVCVNEHGGNCDVAYAEDSFPPFRATLNSFQMEVYEVSVGQYAAFLNVLGPNSHLNGCGGQPCAATQTEEPNSLIAFDGALYAVSDLFAAMPMTHVTWYGAQTYCETAGRRLPTEAEWERAARGGDGRIYPWGNEMDLERANTSRPDAEGPVPVGSFGEAGASPYGVQDLAGNVGEWVQDWYSGSYYGDLEREMIANNNTPILNPTGPVVGTSKVVRGGHWDAVPFFARAVHRQEFEPTFQALSIGFRCVSDETAAQAQPGVNPGGGDTTGLPTFTPVALPTATIDPNLPTLEPTPLPSLPPGG